MLCWIVVYEVPIFRDNHDLRTARGSLVLGRLPNSSFSDKHRSAIVRALARTSCPNDTNTTLVRVQDINVTVNGNSNDTRISYEIDAGHWMSECLAADPNECNALSISSNVYSALHKDQFTIIFLEESAQLGIHIDSGIPRDFEGGLASVAAPAKKIIRLSLAHKWQQKSTPIARHTPTPLYCCGYF